MKIEITSKYYTVKKDLKDLIEKKVDKLSKYFGSDAVANVVCKMESSDLCKMEVTIRSRGQYYRSEIVSGDMYANLDEALGKIERQVIKYGDKFETKVKRDTIRARDLLFTDSVPEFKDDRIVKHKTYELEPISVEQALINLDNLGNTFYIFVNKITKNVNVIYKRLDGNYGLIEAIH